MDHKATSSAGIPRALRELVPPSPSSLSLLLSPQALYGSFSSLGQPGARLITMLCGISLQNHDRNERLEGMKFISCPPGDHGPLIKRLLQLQQRGCCFSAQAPQSRYGYQHRTASAHTHRHRMTNLAAWGGLNTFVSWLERGQQGTAKPGSPRSSWKAEHLAPALDHKQDATTKNAFKALYYDLLLFPFS